MEFRILGPLEVLSDGRALDLGGQKQRVLLAVLLLEANRVVSSDRLIEALWPEEPPNTAQKALQVYVSQLRKLLGRERVETKAPGYLLRVADGELDLQRVEQLREESRLSEALSLWRGAPLSDLAYERAVQGEIGRLEELLTVCLEDRIDADLDRGRHSEVIGELERLVGDHPLRERLREQLMLALYRSGRQAEALDAYQETRRVLVEELGIEPGPRLRQLEQAILRQDPSLEVVRAGSAETYDASDPSRGIFIGRESELGQLRSGLDAAIAGHGGLFLLVGEPGIGKSRLADELMRQARARGADVLVGRCWEAGGAPAYWPWVQSLRAYIEESDPETLRSQLGAGAADMAQIVPELRALLPDLDEPSLEGEGARFRLFDAAGRFLRNAAASRPLVLILDDLHAADEPSLLLLRFLAGELASSRILVVGTYRDVDPTVRDPLASTLAELAREPVTRRLELTGLTEADVARYIELSAEAAPPAELVATIHAETEGNPLFVGEVVRLLAPEGRLPEVDVPALWTLGVPQGVREVIGRRLQRLSGECTRVLTLASVLGREFGLDALGQVSELSADELLDILDEATTARVLAAVPGAHGRLRFAHALIRETLYEGLTTPRRVQLHRRVAEALGRLYAQDPEPHLAELAYHFFEAAPGGDVDKALEYARHAGDRALALLAYEEAARLYELALQALELKQTVDPATRCQLLLGSGDALAKAGSTPEAKQRFLAAAEHARSFGLPEHLGLAALGYGGRFPWLRAGDDERLVPLLEEALTALGEETSALRAKLLARLAGALRDQPSLEPRASLGHQAVELARRLGDADTMGYTLVALALATWGPEPEKTRVIAEEVTRLVDETGDAELGLQACWLHRIVCVTVGDEAAFTAITDEYCTLADELKQPSQQWYGVVMRSADALFRGKFSEAEQLAEQALVLGRQAQAWDAGFSYRIALFTLRREQGRLEEVEGLIRRSVDEYSGYWLFRCLVALLECELGREDQARPAFEELAAADFALLPRDNQWLFSLSVLAEVAAYLRDRDRAAILYRLLLPHRRLNAVAADEMIVGSVARYLGTLAATDLRWEDAAGHFEDALEMNARLGTRPWSAHTQRDYGQMLMYRDASGDREKAGQLLAQALATYNELGMKTYAARTSSLLSTVDTVNVSA